MTRLIDLPAVLFPVELRPILADIPDSLGDRLVPVTSKKAIVNLSTRQVLGIVGRDYRLVTNQEALEMAYECCCAVFPESKPIEWQVTAVDAPMTGGHCCIDLQHNSTALDFNCVPAGDRPDVFGPFIRVTNSYNGLRALTFNIGFFRKVSEGKKETKRERKAYKNHHEWKKQIKEKPDIKLQISALGIHPITNRLFVLSGPEQILFVFDMTGKIEYLERLNKELFPQPEGITFLKNGDMLVSNEGRGNLATMVRFNYKPGKTPEP